MMHRISIQLLLSYSIFLLCSSVFSILQFLGNFLHSIPGEDGSIHHTSVLSHAQLDLPIDWLPVNCRLWDPSSRRDSIDAYSEFHRSEISRSYSVEYNFSGLNFYQEQLVGLFVSGLLGDLVHQNRILCESEENDSKHCSVDFSLTSTLQHWSENLLFPHSLCLSSNGFPRHAAFAFSLKSKLTTWNVRNRGFKHCGNAE